MLTIRDVFPKLKVDYPDMANRINYPYVVPMASRTINMKGERSPQIYLNPEMTYEGALTVPFSEYEINATN